MNYREKRALACLELFEGFHPDVSRCRKPLDALLVRELASLGQYTNEIAEVLGRSSKAIQKLYRAYSFPDMQNFFPPRLDERKDWKHGLKMMKGYSYQRTLNHPNSTKHGNYVAVHRLVIEGKIGRYLTKTEVVDHIDGDITNNHPDNLRVFSSNAEHLRVTLKGKIPNWTEEGKIKILAGCKNKSYLHNKAP